MTHSPLIERETPISRYAHDVNLTPSLSFFNFPFFFHAKHCRWRFARAARQPFVFYKRPKNNQCEFHLWWEFHSTKRDTQKSTNAHNGPWMERKNRFDKKLRRHDSSREPEREKARNAASRVDTLPYGEIAAAERRQCTLHRIDFIQRVVRRWRCTSTSETDLCCPYCRSQLTTSSMWVCAVRRRACDRRLLCMFLHVERGLALLHLHSRARVVSMVLCFASVACVQSNRIRIIWNFLNHLISSEVVGNPPIEINKKKFVSSIEGRQRLKLHFKL